MRRLLLSACIATLLTTGSVASAGPVEDAMNADRAFAKMAQEKGVGAAFGAYAAPNGMRFVPGPAPQKGRDVILKAVTGDFADGSKLNWEPREGVPSADGSMVVVWGRWVFTPPKGAAGPAQEIRGTYLTVWAKQPDGSWKYTHDIGNPDPRGPRP
jgi:ketosteroid isomerase-like protein